MQDRALVLLPSDSSDLGEASGPACRVDGSQNELICDGVGLRRYRRSAVLSLTSAPGRGWGGEAEPTDPAGAVVRLA